MLNLSFDTKDKSIQDKVISAYEKASSAFFSTIKQEMGENISVGKGGSHVWIYDKKNGKRLAIITI